MLRLLAAVFIGSGIGGVIRFLISYYLSPRFSTKSLWTMFPWPTFTVNILGCFLIGLIFGLIDSGSVHLSDQTKTFLTAGLCGGLTTFSTFTHENYLLFQSHNFPLLALYTISSLVIGFAAAHFANTLTA